MKWSALVRTLCAASFLSLALLGVSCGNGGSQPADLIGVSSGTGYVFIADAPPAGTSILKFEITLSAATLCPTVGSGGECQGSPQVELISAPVTIEVTQLQLKSAFLSLKTATAGSYAGVRLRFSNPELKVLKTDGSVQELEGLNLPLSPTSVTPTFQNGLTVAGNTNFGFLIDFNLKDSIQSSGGTITGISPVVGLVKLPVTTQQAVEELEDTAGKVGSLSKNCPTGSFTLTDSLTGLLIDNVQFDGTTEFDDGLTCETLANNQIVEADLELLSQTQQSARFFAKEIELANESLEPSLVGTVFRVDPFDSTNNRYRAVLLVNKAENVSGVSNGALVTISINPATVLFQIDTSGLPVNSSAFESGADLQAGQALDVGVQSGSVVVGTNDCAAVDDGCTADAEKIKLKKGSVTGRVAGTSDPTFQLDTLPSIFGGAALLRPLSADCQNCSIASITVTTSQATEFEDIANGFSGLQVGNIVTIRGFLLKDTFQGPGPVGNGFPALVAGKVRLVSLTQ